MKLCFISAHAYSLFNPKCNDSFGGAEVQLYLLAKELSKSPNMDVHLIVADFGQKPVEEYDGVKVHKTYTLRRSSLRYVTGIMAVSELFLALKRVNADVYIQRAAGVETGVIGLFCKLFNKKFIFMTASQTDCDGRLLNNDIIIKRSYLYGIRCSTHIVTQNREDQKLFKQTFSIDSSVIRNSFPFCENKENSSKKNILWVSSAQPLKQPELFLELAKQFPQEHFMLILSRNTYHETLFKSIEERAKSIQNISFLSQIPFAEVDEYYKQAKLFINTSTHEGFPNTFIQAAINKTPIVSLNVNPDNFLYKYQCGYCSEGSLEKLAEFIRHIITDKNHWEVMSENAFRYAKEHHDIRENIILFKEMLSKG